MAKESNTGGSNHFYYQETPRGRGASCSDNLQSVLMSLVGCQTIAAVGNIFQIIFKSDFEIVIYHEESNYEILSEGRNLLADVIISRCRITPKITFLNVRIETIFG
jgi:hypothetical protein